MAPTPPLPPTRDPSPSEAIHPELTNRRIQLIARTISRFWNLKVRHRLRYDCNWNTGCDCYQWVRAGLRRLAALYPEWLRIVNDESDLAFLFLVGRSGLEVPVKFYRPDAYNQPAQTLRVSDQELIHRQLAFASFDLPPENSIRFAIARRADGLVERVTLVQLDLAGTPIYSWPIPLVSVSVINFNAPREEGVHLPEPSVGLPEDRTDQDEQGQQGRQKA